MSSSSREYFTGTHKRQSDTAHKVALATKGKAAYDFKKGQWYVDLPAGYTHTKVKRLSPMARLRAKRAKDPDLMLIAWGKRQEALRRGKGSAAALAASLKRRGRRTRPSAALVASRARVAKARAALKRRLELRKRK